MAKKKKNPENPTTTNLNSTVFETLFGNLPENDNKNEFSIFSDQNPFKRKTIENSEENKTGVNLELQKSPVLVEKKRKKDKNNSNLGSDDETEQNRLGNKKSRNGSLERSDFDVKSGKNSENFAVDVKKVKNGEISDVKKVKNGEKSAFDVKKVKNGENSNVKKVKNSEKSALDVKNSEISDLDVKRLKNGENSVFDVKKSEKKRKRDEVEVEYEANRYGEGDKNVSVKKVGEKRKKEEETLEVVSKEGFDDEEKLLRTVFVGNLPVKIKKKALLSEFKQFGDVESLRIRSVPLLDTKKPRKGAIMQKKINDAVDSVHAYVVFKLEEAAQAALAHNMAVVGGKHIRVDRACPPRKKLKGDSAPLYDNKRTVFVGNLPFDVKDEELYQLFSTIKDLESDSIEGIRVIRDPGSSLGKGIAYVLFKTRIAANLISRKHGLKLRDRELRISHSKSNLTPTKRKDSPSGERNDSRTKKFALQPANQGSDGKYNFNAGGSYQGLRASKSGVEKKASRPKGNEPVKFTPKAQSGQKVKDRSGKRPAVAARKAKALKGDSSSKQAGFKRKMDSRTPASARGRPNKKAKRN